jgi:hypothetical protein
MTVVIFLVTCLFLALAIMLALSLAIDKKVTGGSYMPTFLKIYAGISAVVTTTILYIAIVHF